MRDFITPWHPGCRSWLFAGIALATCVAVSASESTCLAQGTKPAPKAAAADTGGAPRDYRSQSFFLHTDLPAAEAEDLLKRLEKMLGLISAYWGRRPDKIIEIYAIKDLSVWPNGALDPAGRASVESGGGITLSRGYVLPGTGGSSPNRRQKLGNVNSVCYAVAERGTPQHEAVHAYCAQTFGTTGPTWYSEGMAEMGQYWRDGENRSVQIHPGIIEYFRREEIKSLNGIVNNRESTGDSWQNYAWRWALCHLLATNPNYAPKFRPLGLDLLGDQVGSFESTYGAMANEMSFEYRFFIANICNGFRCDLAAFDWKRKFAPLKGTAGITTNILADRGWQPTQAGVLENKTYEYTATGSWQTSADGGNVTANGNSDGAGKLIGVLMTDFKLSEPFDLGTEGTFTAPVNGNLWVRCNDTWDSLADNKGKLTLKIKPGK